MPSRADNIAEKGPTVINGEFGQPVLEARDLVLIRGNKRLIDGIDLGIRSSRTVIMGANGSGKSLLLRLMHGLIKPTEGQVSWQGEPLDRAARDQQALVFQKPVMLRRSVLANLRFALAVRGIGGRERARRAEEALETARLTELANRPARVLSGGEQQRLAIARALACAPRLLFLDEPTASLDPASTLMIEQQIADAHAAGVIIVMVTHDVNQARRIADDIVFLHAGRVAERGPASRVLSKPSSEPARAWLEGRLYVGAGDTNEI
jgi:tungstate transport system ATP-binding protein